MANLRVLQLIDSLDTGGAERAAVNIANELVGKVDLSCLCATRHEGGLKHSLKSGVNYFFLNKKSKLDFFSIKKMKNYIVYHKINIIHAHSSSFFLAVIIKHLVPRLKIKIIWHDHYGNSEFLKKRKSSVLKVFSKSFSKILSVNKSLEVWSKSHLKHKNVMYLQNFALKDSVKPVTKLKGVKGNRIICLANLRPQKDHFTLLRAFEKVLKTNPSWSLHIVGKDFDDSYSNRLKQQVNMLKLTSSVFFYGSREDIGNILNQSTIGVLSSESEGLPLSLLEYGLAGLPVVVTDVGECSDVVGFNEEKGIVVQPKNEDVLALAIKKLINNPKLRKEKSVAFNQAVSLKYSADAVLKIIVSQYNSLFEN